MVRHINLNHTANPFDYIITTKSFLLNYLENIQLKGVDQDFFKNYQAESEWSLYQMPLEQTDGVLVGTVDNGVYLWHAFTRNEKATSSHWTSAIDNVIDKYSFLFTRFAERMLTVDSIEKTFIISNTQINLKDFGIPERWRESFGFDADFLDSINSALNQITSGCYKILCIVRSLEEFTLLTSLSSSRYEGKCHILYGGVTGVSSAEFVPQVLREIICPYMNSFDLPDISGFYDNGTRIVKIQSNSFFSYSHYLVYKSNNKVWAAITSTISGSYAIFEGGGRYSMVAERETLYFSNKTRWTKVSS